LLSPCSCKHAWLVKINVWGTATAGIWWCWDWGGAIEMEWVTADGAKALWSAKSSLVGTLFIHMCV
jgi:hypothetical protein